MMVFLLYLLANTGVAVDLDEAYQREFSYLRAEKEALQERLTQLKAESVTRASAAETEVQRLQSRLMGLRTESALAEDVLLDAERAQTTRDEQSDLMEATLFQADSTLKGFDVPEGEATSADQALGLTASFEEVSRRLDEAGQVRTEQGEFFLSDGSVVTGQVVHVGRIANYGVSDDASGSLIPVGEGKLQIRDGAANTATALAANAAVDQLEIFVHEGIDKRVDEASEKTLGMWVQNGGVVGLVIIGLGFAGVILAFLRVLGILRARGGAFLPRKIAGLLETGKWGDAFAMVANETNPTERVLSMVLQAGQFDTASLDDTAAEAILAETPAIERYGSAILIVAAVAPLLGLLGTVTGMIGTFDLITEFGTGDPRMLSGGISEALVTTQMGLIVAIPMLLLGNLLNRMGEEVIGRLEISALTVINRMHKPSVVPTTTPPGAHLAGAPLVSGVTL
jgi:biopolymer transport protein ExbB